MRKIFCILSILTIMSPAVADPVAGEPATPSPSPVTTGTLTASTNPAYPLASAHSTADDNVVSAGYVKGAYNATIKAVNTIHSTKQDKLTTTNVITSGSGAVVTGVTANNGTVTVAKGEVTIPVGSATNPTTYATIWVQERIRFYF